MTTLGFDIISDLNLDENIDFHWETKPTSLYCIVAGNISENSSVVYKTLKHLSKCYQGVFYIDGIKEHKSLIERNNLIADINRICSTLKNVVYLHNNVVVVDGIALVGINGWGNYPAYSDDDRFHIKAYRYDDLVYLEKTVEKLQLHIDVKRIVIISNGVPSDDMYFGEKPQFENDVQLDIILSVDTEKKISHWLFGSYEKIVDIVKNDINYLTNPCYDRNPYYAKRIDIEL